MSGNVLPLATLYSANVEIMFQSSRILMGTSPERNTAGYEAFVQFLADTTAFPSPEVAPNFGNADVPITPFATTKVTTAPLNFIIRMALSDAEKSIVNLDLISVYSQVQGYAAGRSVDYNFLNQIYANPLYPNAIPATPGTAQTLPFVVIPATVGPNTGLNTVKINQANIAMNNNAVDGQSRYLAGNTNIFETLLEDEKYASWFYAGGYALQQSSTTLRPYLDVQFKQLPANSSNAIVTTNISYGAGPKACTRTFAILYQYVSTATYFNKYISTTVAPELMNARTSLLTQMIFNQNVLQPKGVVLIEVILDAVTGEPLINS